MKHFQSQGQAWVPFLKYAHTTSPEVSFSRSHESIATVEDKHNSDNTTSREAPILNRITHEWFCNNGLPKAAGEYQLTTVVEMLVT